MNTKRFMRTLDNQFSFLFTFVLLPSPIDSKMHNFSFLTCLKLPQSLWHLRFDDVWHFTLFICMSLFSTNCKLFYKRIHTLYIRFPSLCQGKDSMDSIDPPYPAKRRNCFLNCSFPPEKDEISREQPEIWV